MRYPISTQANKTMNSLDIDRVHAIFDEALTHASDTRTTFVEQACKGDLELQREVEELLKHHTLAAPDFLETTAHQFRHCQFSPHDPDPLIGNRIGRYLLKSVIASGGMGTVYEATQELPNRTVAVKVLRSWVAEKSVVRRFEFESQVLAQLTHPNIARLYQASTHLDTESGRRIPYFAMELIADAEIITQYCSQGTLDIKQRLKLFLEVCDAVYFAHQKGVIHRDLKPGNILVDSDRHIKIIDFGVAHATDSDIAVTTTRTDIGQVIGTLQYMSPEQCRCDINQIGVRTDVYSLGVVLFELLTGHLPYEIPSSDILSAARVIRETSPKRPSSIASIVSGDLETITLKALEKNQSQRYQSVADLAKDIRRYLDHKPIQARRPTTWYKAKLFVRRNKTFSIMGGAFVIAIVAFIISLSSMVYQLQDALTAERWNKYISDIRTAELANVNYDSQTALIALESAPEENRNWEWHYLKAQSDQSLSATMQFSSDGWKIHAISFQAERAIGWRDQNMRVWNTTNGQVLGNLHHELGLSAISAEGQTIALGSHVGQVTLWNVMNLERIGEIAVDSDALIVPMAFGLQGKLLITRTDDHIVQAWRVDTCACVWTKTFDDIIYKSRFSEKSNRFLVTAGNGDITVFECDNWSIIFQHSVSLPGERIEAAISEDGSLLAIHDDNRIEIWNIAENRRIVELANERQRFNYILFSPDNNKIAVLHDTRIRLWDLSTGATGNVRGPVQERDPRFIVDDHVLTTVSNGMAHTWSLTLPAQFHVLHGHTNGVRSVAFNPDGTRLASCSHDGTIRIWDLALGEQLVVLTGHTQSVVEVAFSPDGRTLASVSDDHTTALWNAYTGRRICTMTGHNDSVKTLAFSPDGSILATGSWDKTVRFWDAHTGQKLLHKPLIHDANIKDVVYSLDGKTLISGTVDGSVHIWDLQSAQQSASLRAHNVPIECLAVSPDGKYFLSVGGDSKATIFDGMDINSNRSLTLSATASSVSISPDGSRFAIGLTEPNIVVWDAAKEVPIVTLRGHKREVATVAFSPDGKRIASGDWGGEIRIWDSVPFRERITEYEDLKDAVTYAEEIVKQLLIKLTTPEAVANQLLNDPALEVVMRRAALNSLLKKSAENANRPLTD